MRQIIESLRRLYQNGIVNREKVIDLYKKNKITKEEMEYILEYEQSK